MGRGFVALSFETTVKPQILFRILSYAHFEFVIYSSCVRFVIATWKIL